MPLNSAGLCPPLPSPKYLLSVIQFNPLTHEVRLNTYVRTYIHIVYGSISISQRQWDLQVTNCTSIHIFLQSKIL